MSRLPPVLEDALGFNLYRVAQLFRAELLQALADYGLTPEQWQVMQALWSTDRDLNQQEVAHLTLKNKPTVSRMLRRMERDGWVQRRPDPEDARAYLVEPTPQARQLRDEVPQRLFAHFEPILNALDEDESDTLLHLLKKLRHHLGDE